MSQTKEELLRHLRMDNEIYSLMANEADHIYTWLTSHSSHFKPTSKQQPPYDWSDITEQAKFDAAIQLSRSPDARTAPYWALGNNPMTENNWIAIWFIYHKFRYRDGRNRSRDSKNGSKKSKGNPKKGQPPSLQQNSSSSGSSSSYSAQNSVYYTSPNYSTFGSNSSLGYYASSEDYDRKQDSKRVVDVFYDPVRDVKRPKT